MVVAILQFDLHIRGAESIKDKRRVINSVKDTLHREHQVSVAEVGMQDSMHVSRLALALVATDGKYAGQVLDRISAKLRARLDCEMGDASRCLLNSLEGADELPEGPATDAQAWQDLDMEMLKRAGETSDRALPGENVS
ncbi:MAG: DUF503 family protein [Tepidisphaera sp.]|nr:DUF503 family protein [Tepidisphaera sp.]